MLAAITLTMAGSVAQQIHPVALGYDVVVRVLRLLSSITELFMNAIAVFNE